MTRHTLKMAAVQTSNGKPATVTLVNKYKALDEWMSNPYNYSKEI